MKNQKEDENGLYRYMSSERGVQVLTDKILRFSSPLLFNDLFDVPRDPFQGKTAEQILHHKAEIFYEYAYKNKDITGLNERYQNVIRYLRKESKTIQEIEEIIKKSIPKSKGYDEQYCDINKGFSKILRLTRICCFCRDANTISLWYHYSNQYKGIVIEYDADKLKQHINKSVGNMLEVEINPVKYLNNSDMTAFLEQLHFNITAIDARHSSYNEKVMQMFYNKDESWANEQEERIILTIDENEDSYNKGLLYSNINVSPDCITAIYLGPFIDIYDKEKILFLASTVYPNVKVYQMGVSHYKFSKTLIE